MHVVYITHNEPSGRSVVRCMTGRLYVPFVVPRIMPRRTWRDTDLACGCVAFVYIFSLYFFFFFKSHGNLSRFRRITDSVASSNEERGSRDFIVAITSEI